MSSSEVLWLFFFQFSFQQSTAQSTGNRPMILTLTDHHCQHWLKKRLPSSPCDLRPYSPSPPSAAAIEAYQVEEQSTAFLSCTRISLRRQLKTSSPCQLRWLSGGPGSGSLHFSIFRPSETKYDFPLRDCCRVGSILPSILQYPVAHEYANQV